MPNAQQYSMVGHELTQGDNSQARTIGDLLQSRFVGANPKRSEMARYLGTGLPVDYEGMLTNYAMKYGQPAASKLLDVLPTLGVEDLMAIQKDVEGANREADAQLQRERNTYVRNGVSGYDPINNPRKP